MQFNIHLIYFQSSKKTFFLLTFLVRMRLTPFEIYVQAVADVTCKLTNSTDLSDEFNIFLHTKAMQYDYPQLTTAALDYMQFKS